MGAIAVKSKPQATQAVQKMQAVDWTKAYALAAALFAELPVVEQAGTLLLDAMKRVWSKMQASGAAKECPCPGDQCEKCCEAIEHQVEALACLICLHCCQCSDSAG